MRIIRPQQLVVLKNGYQIGRESQMGISVIAGCYLSQPDHFVTEPQIWQAWKSAPLSFHMLDSAEPKPFAEFLLAGHAETREPLCSLDVEARVGTLTRRWRIEGESSKAGIKVKPFIRMPMDHPQSWGGKGCKENPLGQGYNDGSHPTIMSIGFDGAAISRSPLAAPTPVPHDFQVRKAYLDAVSSLMTDKHYLESYYPGLPPVIDRRYFQMAPPSQWLKHAEWPDSIPYELTGFAPNGERVAGNFPSVRARAFIWQKNDPVQQEISLQRKTLWLLPDHNIGLMVFTGHIPLTHLFDEPVETLLVALENSDTQREDEHYQQVFSRRSMTTAATFEFLNDPELMPVGMTLNVIRDLTDHPDSLRYQATPLTKEESQRFYQDIRETIERQKQHQEPELPPKAKAPPAEQVDAGMQWLQQNADNAENVTFAGTHFSDLMLQNKSFRYCTFNHCQFQRTILADCRFEFCQFTHCHFADADWQNVSVSGCFIKHSVWHKMRLAQGKYEKVTLENSQFQQCYFSESHWENCIFTKTNFSNSQFVQCALNGSFWTKSHFDQLKYQHSQLTTCIFDDCSGPNTLFATCTLAKNSFIAGNWGGTHFDHCEINSVTTGLGIDLSESQFTQCRMNKVGFCKANLRASNFTHCSLLEACCDNADLQQATVTSCDMTAVRLKDASLTHSLWQNTSLQQGMLYNTDLRDSQFIHCNLAGANLAMTSQNLATRFEHCLLEKAHWLPRRYKTAQPLHH
ncbi:DUF2169 family type VI secretion system accessory protein [Serratia fonticola]|uniref:DUF2169 family type VI secretion system accessory protein n=1 Tax=Serratia fonticola TaxID=47917 RepID=UPI003BB7B256